MKMTRFLNVVLSSCLAVSAFGAPYDLVDLGELGVPSYGFDINNQGEAVGYYITPNNVTRGWFFNGSLTDIGTLDVNNSSLSTRLLEINNAGVAVGYGSKVIDIDGVSTLVNVPIIYQNGVLTEVAPPAGHNDAFLLGLNHNDLYAGYVRESTEINGQAVSLSRAAILDRRYGNDLYTVVGTLRADGTGSSTFRAISDNNIAVGWSSNDSDNGTHAVYYDVDNQQLVDIGTLGGLQGAATAINSAGLIVGDSTVENETYRSPFKYQIGVDDALVALPVLNEAIPNGRAFGVNENGDIVGWTTFERVEGSERVHAVLWKNGEVIDLNNQIDCQLGWTLLEARAINDQGQIVGTGLKDGQLRAFLLTPNPNGGTGEVCQAPGESPRHYTIEGGSVTWFMLVVLGLVFLRRSQ